MTGPHSGKGLYGLRAVSLRTSKFCWLWIGSCDRREGKAKQLRPEECVPELLLSIAEAAAQLPEIRR